MRCSHWCLCFLICLASAGCGRLWFVPLGESGDAGIDAREDSGSDVPNLDSDTLVDHFRDTAFDPDTTLDAPDAGPPILGAGWCALLGSNAPLDGSFRGPPNAARNLWHVNLGTGAFTPLTRSTQAGMDTFRAIAAPDAIIFGSNMPLSGDPAGPINPSTNLFRVNYDGSGLTALTMNTAPDLSVADFDLDPTGASLVYSSRTSLDGSWNGTPAAHNIWVLDVGSATHTPLTQNTDGPAISRFPVFSPEGAFIAFTSKTALNGDWSPTDATASSNLWVMRRDGTDRVPLTRNALAGANSALPSFASTGDQILFESQTALDGSWDVGGGQTNIWRVDIDGTSRVPITQNQTCCTSHNVVTSSSTGTVAFQTTTALSGVWNDPATMSQNIWTAASPMETPMPFTTRSSPGGTSSNPVFAPEGDLFLYRSRLALDGDAEATALPSDNLWVARSSTGERRPVTAITEADYWLLPYVRGGFCRP